MRRQPECLSLPLWVCSQLTRFNICRTIWIILYKVKHAAEIKLAFFFYYSVVKWIETKKPNEIVESTSMKREIMAQKKRVQNQRNKLHFITCLRILVSERGAQKCHIDDGIYRIHRSHSTMKHKHTIIHEIFLNALTKHCDWAPNCYDNIQNAKSTYKHGTAQHNIKHLHTKTQAHRVLYFCLKNEFTHFNCIYTYGVYSWLKLRNHLYCIQWVASQKTMVIAITQRK